MVTIAGYWDLGYNSPLREAERWDFMVKDFDLTNWHMIPVSGIKTSVKLIEKATLEDIFALYPGVQAVFMDESAGTTLENFVHPTDVIYVFGKSAYSPLGLMREGDVAIKINTPSVGGLWGDQAAVIVLYDRMLKKG